MPRERLDWFGARDQVGQFLDRLARALRQPEPVRTLLYSASMTPDCQSLTVAHLIVTVTNGTAFTVNAPINAEDGCELWLEVFNNSGGAMGAVTWNAVYVFDTAWTNPGNGVHRVVGFYRRGGSWYQLAQSIDSTGGGGLADGDKGEVITSGGATVFQLTASGRIAERAFAPHPPRIPDVRATAPVTATPDAQGYLVALVAEDASQILPPRVFSPHPPVVPEVLPGIATSISRDARGYMPNVLIDDVSLHLSQVVFGAY